MRIIEKVAQCSECFNEQIIKFAFDDEGELIAVEPFVCTKCQSAKSCIIMFDADPNKFIGIYGSNGV